MGTWRGPGEGHYPTIADFGYLEELIFSHVGKPFQPTGVVEIHAGSVEEKSGGVIVDLRTERVEGTRTAKPITEVRRRLEVTGDSLKVDMWMAAMGEPLTHHLSAELTRNQETLG